MGSNRTGAKHIIVMLAGTVNPFNISGGRAASYGDNNYWQQYPEFMQALKHVTQQFANVAIFDAHGWSGDNTAAKRRIAGTYLAERLCGANGKAAYYSGYLKTPVYFHLIGHSHGGNIANEIMRRAAELTEWPPGWLFASVCYLSTPFYSYQHLPATLHWALGFKAINLFNRYDLTQRFAAVVSLQDMVQLAQSDAVQSDIVQHTAALSRKFKAIPWCQLQALRSISYWRWVFRPYSIKLSTGFIIALYDFLQQLITCLDSALHFISALMATSPQQDSLNPGAFAGALQQQLQSLRQAVQQTFDAAAALVYKDEHSLLRWLQQCSALLHVLRSFLTLNDKQDGSTIISLLRLYLQQQLEVVAMTAQSPKVQSNLAWADILTELDITELDPFDRQVTPGFELLAARLCTDINRMQAVPSNNHLAALCLHLLMFEPAMMRAAQAGLVWHHRLPKLLKQHKAVAVVARVQRFVTRNPLLSVLTCGIAHHPLWLMLQQLILPSLSIAGEYTRHLDADLLAQRYKGGSDTKGLAHFLLYSHSISRQTLHPVLQQWLIAQLMQGR
ncbi:hypothetical protein [Rheinheimera sp.]|uniref:hypothetical protein n=1 Tax=Rheinheimera sp. TaxID=1869214 RepID=UPI0027371E1A|nr:hypothetical protein [Rheinheimera sp.]MDP2713864.1 hypothetical protein [Rheinheimera sp.]